MDGLARLVVGDHRRRDRDQRPGVRGRRHHRGQVGDRRERKGRRPRSSPRSRRRPGGSRGRGGTLERHAGAVRGVAQALEARRVCSRIPRRRVGASREHAEAPRRGRAGCGRRAGAGARSDGAHRGPRIRLVMRGNCSCSCLPAVLYPRPLAHKLLLHVQRPGTYAHFTTNQGTFVVKPLMTSR
jgi:hypothetical protein